VPPDVVEARRNAEIVQSLWLLRPWSHRHSDGVAITHTFRHIFWLRLATTNHKLPMVRNRRSRCGAMVSTTCHK